MIFGSHLKQMAPFLPLVGFTQLFLFLSQYIWWQAKCTWYFEHSNAGGHVECKGQGSSDPDAPCVELQISSSFGQTCIIFG